MEKLKKLQKYLEQKQVHVAIINNPAHLYYLSGFSGSNGFLLVQPDNAYFYTDPRYAINAKSELPDKFKINIIQGSILDSIISFLVKHSVKTLAITEKEMSYAYILRLKERLKNIEIVEIEKIVDDLVNPKNEDQIMGVCNSLSIAEDGLEATIAKIQTLTREIDFSRELQMQLLKKGAFEIAFPPIVAWEANSAEPHHKTSDTLFLGQGKLLIDTGAVYDGFYSDITRMVYLGEPDPYFKRIYEIVRTAKNKVIDEIKPGVKVNKLAKIIYDYFVKKSVDKFIGHYFGHGIGRKAHEPPLLSLNSEETLKENSIIMVEPGLYINGWGGVRIEDTVLVEKDGANILNRMNDQFVSLRLPASQKKTRERQLV